MRDFRTEFLVLDDDVVVSYVVVVIAMACGGGDVGCLRSGHSIGMRLLQRLYHLPNPLRLNNPIALAIDE